MNAQSPLRRRREIILSPRLGETLIVEMINAFAWAPLFRTSSASAAACN
jgi:hypothetical protein